jgi:hypothetical protein
VSVSVSAAVQALILPTALYLPERVLTAEQSWDEYVLKQRRGQWQRPHDCSVNSGSDSSFASRLYASVHSAEQGMYDIAWRELQQFEIEV